MISDALGRPVHDLRVSVTDRCNFRCTYCMPHEEYQWIERSEVLSFEEITRLVSLFRGLGVGKVRLTGGEPLARKNLQDLVRMLRGLETPFDHLKGVFNSTSYATFPQDGRSPLIEFPIVLKL